MVNSYLYPPFDWEKMIENDQEMYDGFKHAALIWAPGLNVSEDLRKLLSHSSDPQANSKASNSPWILRLSAAHDCFSSKTHVKASAELPAL